MNTPRIRVLHIQETIGSGGVERRRLSLAKYLDSERFELKIVCTQTHGPMADSIRACGVEVLEIGTLRHPLDWKQHRKVQRIIADFQPHIVHGAVFEGVTMAAVNGFIKRVPIVIIEETSDPQNRSWKGHALMRWFARVSDAVVGVSPAAVAYLQEQLGLPSRKVHLLMNGVAVPRPVSEAERWAVRASLGIAPETVVIGSTGRMLLDSHKRFSDLIRAVALLRAQSLPVALLLVGDGPQRAVYTELAADLGVSDSVFFAGYQDDIALYYHAFDVFSLASAYEAFGLVLAEAMLCELPVVATRVGGMVSIVAENETGFLVPPQSVSELAEALKALVVDSALRNRMGAAGKERALTHFTEERYVRDVVTLYEGLLASLTKPIKER